MSATAYEPVPSPCVQVCVLNADRICVGCGRSIAEIAEWGRAADARRLQIRADAARRLAIIGPPTFDAPAR